MKNEMDPLSMESYILLWGEKPPDECLLCAREDEGNPQNFLDYTRPPDICKECWARVTLFLGEIRAKGLTLEPKPTEESSEVQSHLASQLIAFIS